MDVTRIAQGPGLSEAQLSRLDALERAKAITGFEAGEAQFLATQGTPDERERAERIAAKAGRKGK
jgi:hypothetical protein